MNWTSWAGLAALGAMAASCWRTVALILRRIGDLVVCRTMVTGEAAAAVLSLAWAEGKRSPLGLRVFGGQSLFVNPVKRQEVVAFEGVSSDPILFWFDGRPVVIGRRPPNADINAGDQDSGDHLFLFYFRGTFDTDAFLIRAVEHLNKLRSASKEDNNQPGKKRRRHRFEIRRIGASKSGSTENYPDPYGSGRGQPVPAPSAPADPMGSIHDKLLMRSLRLLKWSPDDLRPQGPEGEDVFAGYAFPPDIAQALTEVQTWLDNEAWFRSKSIPWRRGWLLHGPPGTGKSTLVRAIGMEFDMPIFSFDLACMGNEEFTSAWQVALQRMPCIVLLEDIDTVFEGRVNVSAKGSTHKNLLTFDCLLNCISGVGMNDGVFLMVTTNRLEMLDPALGVPDAGGKSSRPGRIDRALYLGQMGLPERQKLALHILGDWPEEIGPVVSSGEKSTPAQFQNQCAERAMARFWLEAASKASTKDQEIASCS